MYHKLACQSPSLLSLLGTKLEAGAEIPDSRAPLGRKTGVQGPYEQNPRLIRKSNRPAPGARDFAGPGVFKVARGLAASLSGGLAAARRTLRNQTRKVP